MAVETKRGCGYRKIGGLYLVGDGLALECRHLPVDLGACHSCAHSPRFSRNVQRAVPQELFYNLNGAKCESFCPITELAAQKTEPVIGLAWVGEKFYTPASFTQEALELGVSKRVPVVPSWVKLGETWIFLAHPQGYFRYAPDNQKITSPGIFYAFCPQRIEKIVIDQTPEEELAKLREKGITPVVVPHDDPDHQPGASV